MSKHRSEATGMDIIGRIQKSRRVTAGLLFFAFLGVILLLVMLTGAGRETSLPAVPVLENAGGQTVLLLTKQDGAVILICGGEGSSHLLRLNAATGAVEVHRQRNSSISWAGLSGSTLYLREGDALTACDSVTLEQNSSRPLPWRVEDTLFFTCDDNGTAYAVLSQSRRVLCSSGAGGGEATRTFGDPIEFLETAGSGPVLYAGKTLCFPSASGDRTAACSAAPLAWLGRELFLDGDGVMCRLGDSGPEPLYRCGQSIYGRLTYCLDSRDRLVLSSSGGRVYCFSESGAAEETCLIEGAALAVCESGAVTKKSGTLRYTPFSFAPAEPSAAPEATPEPAPAERPPVTVENRCLLLDAGTTVGDLRELFRPEAVLIKDQLGHTMTAGRLATGMTAGDWLIVIRGDCNGSGTVNTADMRTACLMVLKEDFSDEAAFRAADLNDDGVVDTRDLLLLRDLM